MTFYAVCNSNGLISKELQADSRGRAILEVRAAVADQAAIDWLADAPLDLEEACGICCDGMTYSDALLACSEKGASFAWGDDTGDHWAIWEHNAQSVPDCDQEAVTLRSSDLPSVVESPVGKMSYDEAVQAANAGKSIVMCDRDATGHLYVRNACWLEDEGDLVMSHPTERTGTVAAPVDGLYELLFEEPETLPPAEPFRLPAFAVPAIKALWEESQIANDRAQSALCEGALGGDETAFFQCFDAINEAGNVEYNWQLSYSETGNTVLTPRELKTDSAGYCRLIRQSMQTGQAVPTLSGDMVFAAPRS